METPKRIFAVDWSGNKKPAALKKKIWLAETNADGIKTLQAGFDSREAVAEYLIKEKKKDPNFVVGLDFSFSFPLWFVEGEGCTDARSFWQYVEKHGEGWLGKKPLEEPFYTRGKGPTEEPFRATEKHAAQQIPGQSPDNVFHLIGAKQVGKGSIRGMPMLKMLQDEGFSIWPFDPPELPCVVEIYPRLFYGRLRKNSVQERLDFLEPLPILDKNHRAHATRSDDAFDAAVSALKMFERRKEFTELKQTEDPVEQIEGRIWF